MNLVTIIVGAVGAIGLPTCAAFAWKLARFVFELQELRNSHARFMERMQIVEDELKRNRTRDEARREFVQDSKGIPVSRMG